MARVVFTAGRVVAVGLTAGTLCALAASALASELGLEALAPELTLSHIVAACLVSNVAGAAAYLWLTTRTRRAWLVYAGLALAAATAASIRVVVAPPLPGFAAVAVPIHYLVALASAAIVPWWLAAPPTDAPCATTRALVTIVALVTSVSPELADFNSSHLENPLWPPHARYHGVLLACVMVVAGAIAIAMVWRPMAEGERRLRVAIATVLPAAIWASFWLALAFPDTSSWPDGADRPIPIAPNVILGSVVVGLAALAWWRDRVDSG